MARRLIVGVGIASALALGVAACASDEGTSGQDGTVTTPAGPPQVVQIGAPKRFWCLKAFPGQAQVIVGWSVPAATSLVVSLDGKELHQGMREALPFAVVAGKPAGLGVTVVFPCRSGRRHTISMRWTAGDSPPAERSITVTKART
jgi:hypothetical protein